MDDARFIFQVTDNFDDWRKLARKAAGAHIPPDQLEWQSSVGGLSATGESEKSLFAESSSNPVELNSIPQKSDPLRVPPAFLPLARSVACHHDSQRWNLLYRLLYRLTHGEPDLLQVTVDDDVYDATMKEKAVRRDAHKTKAFVRFRELRGEDGALSYVAFHQPDHYILPIVASFFVDRFNDMHWTIMTPDATLSWDRQTLHWLPGLPKSAAPKHDDMEALWKTYYGNIFNPARIKLNAMTKEMPKKFWKTLPEAEIIDQLVADAGNRVEEMMARTKKRAVSAADFLPKTKAEGDHFSLQQLERAARVCEGCDLCHHATQTVFGEGPANAKLVFVGEQPGDQEDLAGRPFVGPAGKLLMDVIEQAGLMRKEIYITNAVKHFKWEADPRGKRRLHKKPGYREVVACKPWVMEELRALKPAMVVCLGVTAAQSLLGPEFRLTPNRGRVWKDTPYAPWLMTTLHPSALLRIPDRALKEQQMSKFAADMGKTADELRKRGHFGA